ncbi:3-deoxy-D-manno-octulosonic acid transferase [Cytophagaceae bacterium SJW1-29]|uniref:3-deoxy-D-manno-octulosonic acid transferase n=2 Tax=Salmonirosea aquatica TaxID=2654236 RepID=A0A7C9F762_9BACT|nr:3-deoxy-D-manno-octulosonic acid transferase [Cytophagaceae bacterium SJW1-29]
MRLASFFHPKARQWINGRHNLMERLHTELPALIDGRPVAWFHAASLGEFEQGRPVIEAFRSRHPDYFIFLTFFSPSGYEVRKNYAQADYISYLPNDTPTNARRLVQLLRPRLVFFIKYEFWYNYLHALQPSGAIILSFSTLFLPHYLFFKPYGGFYRQLLNCFDHILVQNEASAALLRGIGYEKVTVAGDTRFDRVQQIADSTRTLPEIASFVQDGPCLIVGSAWEADRAVIVPALNQLKTPLKVIIAPHEIQETELARWEQTLAGKTLRYSAYQAAGFAAHSSPAAQYLLIDNVGMLSSLYRYGQVAYIGGGFGAGLHNILEAATFGLPVLFGNRSFYKFQEAVDLVAQGGAWAVADTNEFQRKLEDLLKDPLLRTSRGHVGRRYVQEHTGATEAVIRRVEQQLAEQDVS